MSLAILRTAPELLAGVMVLSGRFPGELFEATAPSDAVARVPVFAAHGTYDDVLPIENGRKIRAILAGPQHDFTYREYPVAHGIAPDELAEIARWLAARL